MLEYKGSWLSVAIMIQYVRGIQMRYEFSFYKEEDFEEIEQLVLASYSFEYPVWGLSRQEFTKGLHPAFTGHYHTFEHTVGVYKEDGKIVAVVMNEGNYDGEVFFLFDSQERGEERELLIEMIRFAKTNVSGIKEDRRTKYIDLYVPEWNITLKELLNEKGFTKEEWSESLYVLPFNDEPFDVKLPEGYTFSDGNATPDFYLSNTHRLSFGYGGEDHACTHGEQAFHDLRQMKHYRKDRDICVLDELKRPVEIANSHAKPSCNMHIVI